MVFLKDLYVNDILEAVYSNLVLYADVSDLTVEHEDVHTIEQQLNKDFANLCEWFVDNKLNIHLGERKTKCILLGLRLKLKNAGKLNIMSRESMALKAIKKINQKLQFLCRKNGFITPELGRLLCNAIIQPHFDYVCSAWYPNLTQKLKKKLELMQNECICFYL